MSAAPSYVWIVTEFHNCTGEDAVDLEGTPVVAICATEQLAKQIADRDKYLNVRRVAVATNMKDGRMW